MSSDSVLISIQYLFSVLNKNVSKSKMTLFLGIDVKNRWWIWYMSMLILIIEPDWEDFDCASILIFIPLTLAKLLDLFIWLYLKLELGLLRFYCCCIIITV